MEIREITKDDLNKLVSLYISSYNCEPWCDKWTEKTASKRLSDMLDTPGSFGIVAENEGESEALAIGYFEQYFDGVGFTLREICVKNEHRKSGIGSLVLNELETVLKNKGVRFMSTRAYCDDEEFFLKSGFVKKDDIISFSKEF